MRLRDDFVTGARLRGWAVTTVLIVDDEPDLLETLCFNLEREGWSTKVANDGKTALELAFESPHPDVILLDLGLPDTSGSEVCRAIRANPATQDIPIIIVSAKSDEIDRVVGFEVGADDYVAKPFNVRELRLRIRAVLRRRVRSEPGEERITAGRLELETAAHRVRVDGVEVTLTALEFKLLVHLVVRRGRVQTRETLLVDVWGHGPDLSTRTVDTHIQRLRKKLGPAGQDIETVRGIGYRFGV